MGNSNLDELVKLGAAWVNTAQNGSKFLSTDLYFNGRRVILLRNSYKKPGSQEPDYNIFLGTLPEEKRGDRQGRVLDEYTDPLDDSAVLGDELGDFDNGATPPNNPQPRPQHVQDAENLQTVRRSTPPRRGYPDQHGNGPVPRRTGSPQTANQQGGTNELLGGRAAQVRSQNPQEYSSDDLADPFAE